VSGASRLDSATGPAPREDVTDAVDEFEREIIRAALQHVEFNQTRAADLLGTTRRILKYRMDKLGIQRRLPTPVPGPGTPVPSSFKFDVQRHLDSPPRIHDHHGHWKFLPDIEP
jgi:hypothetical protein